MEELTNLKLHVSERNRKILPCQIRGTPKSLGWALNSFTTVAQLLQQISDIQLVASEQNLICLSNWALEHVDGTFSRAFIACTVIQHLFESIEGLLHHYLCNYLHNAIEVEFKDMKSIHYFFGWLNSVGVFSFVKYFEQFIARGDKIVIVFN